jgi:hypothetical protein
MLIVPTVYSYYLCFIIMFCRTPLGQLIRHSRSPEDGNHMPKLVEVELERINNKNSTTS